MIDLVSSIRDISDSLPALSGGIPGALVESEPDLAVFARDVPEGRRHVGRVPRRRMRSYTSPFNRGVPLPMGGYRQAAPGMMMYPGMQMYSSSSDSDEYGGYGGDDYEHGYSD